MYTRPLVIMGLFYVQKIPYYYGTFLCTVSLTIMGPFYVQCPFYYGALLYV